MFSLKNFLKDGFLRAIGNKPEYEIKLKSAEWLYRGVLNEEDLAEIEEEIEKYRKTLSESEEVISEQSL